MTRRQPMGGSLPGALVCTFACITYATAGLGSQAMTATGVDAGLAVHLGTTDGALEVELGTGSLLVHGLTEDIARLNQARTAIMARGLYGLVSAERATSWAHLPYGERQVNLLIADLDELGPKGLTEQEIDRVLVPGGAGYLKSGGQWRTRRAEWPPGLGSTTHWFANAQGTSVTPDLEMRPPTALKWIANHAEMDRMRYASPTGMRIQGGRTFYEYKTVPMEDNGPTKMVGRDAFNGLLLWQRDGAADEFNFVHKVHRFVAEDGDVYCFPRRDDYAVALGGATGREVRIYSNGLRLTERERVRNQELVVAEGTLIQTGLNRIVALDAGSGAKLWEYAESDTSLWIGRPIVDTEGNRVFCVVSYSFLGGGRWAVSDAKSFLCFDLETGALKWRNDDLDKTFTFTWYKDENLTDVETRYRVGQLAYHNGCLAFFNPEPLGASQVKSGTYRILFAGAIDANSGDLLWVRSFQDYAYTMIARNDTLFLATGSTVHAMPIRTGEIEVTAGRAGKPQFASPLLKTGYNGRCNRATATTNYLIQGLVTYWSPDYDWVYSPVNRSSCATGAFPGHGMVHFTPNGCYGCIQTTLRGYQALRFEPIAEPLDDSERLRPGTSVAGAIKATQTPTTTGAIAVDFANTNAKFYGATTTAPVTVGDLTLTAIVNEHRLEARCGGDLTWSFVAGGRILTAPRIHNNSVAMFGSTDGYVYAVNVSDGSPRWRFMAAPNEKKMVAYGQLESAWPVYGVSFYGNTVTFAAGRHPDLDGGIFAYAVDPSTGALAWRARYATELEQFESIDRVDGKYTFGIDFKRGLNDTLMSALGIDPANPGDRIGRTIIPASRDGQIHVKGEPIPLLDIPVAVAGDRRVSGGHLVAAKGRQARLKAAYALNRDVQVSAYYPGPYRLTIMNLAGRTLYNCTCDGVTTHRFGREQFAAGRYHIVLTDEQRGIAVTARAMVLK